MTQLTLQGLPTLTAISQKLRLSTVARSAVLQKRQTIQRKVNSGGLLAVRSIGKSVLVDASLALSDCPGTI